MLPRVIQIRRQIGANIAAQRVAAGLTLEAVAAELGLAGKTVIWRWETGDRLPDAVTLVRLARLLRCRVVDFFRGVA